MLHLYRGLIDILNARSSALNEDFKKHIQTHRKYYERDVENQVNSYGTDGYWNLILEIIFLIYIKFVHIVGIALIATLAIIFFPLSGMLAIFENMFFRFNREQREFIDAQEQALAQARQEPKQVLMETHNEQGK
jgi:hypothetical protein